MHMFSWHASAIDTLSHGPEHHDNMGSFLSRLREVLTTLFPLWVSVLEHQVWMTECLGFPTFFPSCDLVCVVLDSTREHHSIPKRLKDHVIQDVKSFNLKHFA